MLKNYTVKIENVDIQKRTTAINYILNEKHKNHQNTTIINDNVLDEENFKILITKMLHQNELNYMKNGKGGKKLKRIAKSITFNLPKDYEATPEQLKIIDLKLKKGLLNLCEGLDIPFKESGLFSAIHLEKDKQHHIHLILPTLDFKGQNIRHFNTPAFTKKIKVLFTEIVDNVLNTHISEYKPLSDEQRAEARIINELKALKVEYEALMEHLTDKPKAQKFIKNQITQILRTLESKNPDIAYIEKINKGVDKVLKSETTKNLDTSRLSKITT